MRACIPEPMNLTLKASPALCYRVMLGKFLTLSVSQFLHLLSGDHYSKHPVGLL